MRQNGVCGESWLMLGCSVAELCIPVERLQAWADTGIDGLTIGAQGAAVLELMAQIADTRPAAAMH